MLIYFCELLKSHTWYFKLLFTTQVSTLYLVFPFLIEKQRILFFRCISLNILWYLLIWNSITVLLYFYLFLLVTLVFDVHFVCSIFWSTKCLLKWCDILSGFRKLFQHVKFYMNWGAKGILQRTWGARRNLG